MFDAKKSFLVKWIAILGEQLTKAIKGICPELINDNEYLQVLIHDYVFAQDKNQQELENLLREETESILSFDTRNFNILRLTIKGARMIVADNNMVMPKEFDKFMLQRQAAVKQMIKERRDIVTPIDTAKTKKEKHTQNKKKKSTRTPTGRKRKGK